MKSNSGLDQERSAPGSPVSAITHEPASFNEISQRLFDANVRIEEMFWLGGMSAGVPSDFEDFVQDDLPEEKQILAALPFLGAFLKDDGDAAAEDILAECSFRRKLGFILQLATPIPRDFGKDPRSYSFSWGHYATKWLYCETLNDLAPAAELWATGIVERAYQKAHAS